MTTSSTPGLDTLISSPYIYKDKTDPSTRRGTERFSVTANLISRKDKNNPLILKRVLHEQRIKDISKRLSLPTCSTMIKSEVVHPTMKGHDVKTIDVWSHMPTYDNHFLKRMYDKKGNSRVLNAGQGLECVKALPERPSQRSKEVNFYPPTYPSRFSYRQQWKTNQTTHHLDFKTSNQTS